MQRKSKTDTFTRKLKRNIQRTEPPILRMETGTILIVDDNKSVLASLELLLENVFSTVRTAANPNQITTILSLSLIHILLDFTICIICLTNNTNAILKDFF